jgi:hypothetical protein
VRPRFEDGPHAFSITAVSEAIHVAKEASTQSGKGAELAPYENPPRESKNHRIKVGAGSVTVRCEFMRGCTILFGVHL